MPPRFIDIAELSYQLHDSAAKALITASPATDTVRAAAKHAGITRTFDLQQLTPGSSPRQPPCAR